MWCGGAWRGLFLSIVPLGKVRPGRAAVAQPRFVVAAVPSPRCLRCAAYAPLGVATSPARQRLARLACEACEWLRHWRGGGGGGTKVRRMTVTIPPRVVPHKCDESRTTWGGAGDGGNNLIKLIATQYAECTWAQIVISFMNHTFLIKV